MKAFYWEHPITKLWHGPGLPRPLTKAEFEALEKFFPDRFGPKVNWEKKENKKQNENNF